MQNEKNNSLTGAEKSETMFNEDMKESLKTVFEKLTSKQAGVVAVIATGIGGIILLVREGLKHLGD